MQPHMQGTSEETSPNWLGSPPRNPTRKRRRGRRRRYQVIIEKPRGPKFHLALVRKTERYLVLGISADLLSEVGIPSLTLTSFSVLGRRAYVSEYWVCKYP